MKKIIVNIIEVVLALSFAWAGVNGLIFAATAMGYLAIFVFIISVLSMVLSAAGSFSVGKRLYEYLEAKREAANEKKRLVSKAYHTLAQIEVDSCLRDVTVEEKDKAINEAANMLYKIILESIAKEEKK